MLGSVSNNIQSILFGNFDFFSQYNFEEYFKSKFKFGEKQVLLISKMFFILSLFFIGFQTFFLGIFLEGILIELALTIAFLRLSNYIIFIQFKEYCTTVETIGYFVVNELLVILDTSSSLREATKFIISSKYPLFSEIFTNAMISTHFGNSLNFALKTQITRSLFGNIQTVFLYILEIWENGKNIALLSKNRILSRISDQITEETNKIDSWASLSAGITFLSPPVIFCFLLISGNMSVFFGFLIIIGVIIGSLFIHPERHLTVFSKNNKLFLSYDKKSLELLVILSENLLSGNSFNKSLNNALNVVEVFPQKNQTTRMSEPYTLFKLGVTQTNDIETNFLAKFFPERIIQLVLLIKKFSMIDISIAGKKLQTITKELGRTNELLSKGDAQLKAAKLHGNIIQILALVSLAFIAGASSYFLFVSNMIYQPFTETSMTTSNSVFELIYLITALVISLLPIRRINVKGFRKHEAIPWNGIIGLSKFTVFLIVYTVVKNAFIGMI
ncbi:MAG: hypothetical protein JSW11_13185 [Candidatus Heimdallarchaeota archaeon]|nr:MAG: hypothetical protein JSW11_13185 [Candidatus Heimdallarchaeota archaeon]